MKHIRSIAAILGIVTALGGVTPAVYAAPLLTPATQEKDSAESLYSQGSEKYRAGDLQGAIADYTEAIQLNPKFAQVYVMRGNALYDKGDKQTALKDYEQAIKINSKYASAYVGRGNARDDLGDSKGAIDDYNQAIAINPTLASAYDNRGVTHIRKGNKQAAIADWQKAAELYQKQGSTKRYQETMDKIQKVQSSMNQPSSSSL